MGAGVICNWQRKRGILPGDKKRNEEHFMPQIWAAEVERWWSLIGSTSAMKLNMTLLDGRDGSWGDCLPFVEKAGQLYWQQRKGMNSISSFRFGQQRRYTTRD